MRLQLGRPAGRPIAIDLGYSAARLLQRGGSDDRQITAADEILIPDEYGDTRYTDNFAYTYVNNDTYYVFNIVRWNPDGSLEVEWVMHNYTESLDYGDQQ